jgi:interleukin-like EMT inducer protein
MSLAGITAITHHRWPFELGEEDIPMSSDRKIVINPFLENLINPSGSRTSATFDIDSGGGRSQSISLSAEQIQGVRPGDVITSDLFNRLLARLAALEASHATSILLGPLGENTHTLVALSTGFETGGGIFLDGVSLLSTPVQRGINLVILHPDLKVKHKGAYDTLIEGTASADLVKDLQNQAAEGYLVLVATHENYAAGLSPAALQALAAVGGAAMAVKSNRRDNAAFIGIVPSDRANVRYNYLVSHIPADGKGFLAALPFVWGIYSIPLKRFLLGGGSSSEGTTASEEADEPKKPKVSGKPKPRRKQPAARKRGQ